MSRSSFALLTLLASLAGPLVFAPAARSEQPLPTCPAEAYCIAPVCTPPAQAVHPADNEGLAPYPGYDDEYWDAEAEASWRSPTPAPNEDWRDFVIENQASSITNQYDDLFETMTEVAAQASEPSPSAIVEADEQSYKADAQELSEYDPYEANAKSDDPEYASIEAYEAEFSGYGTTDYLRDNFDYEAVAVKRLTETSMLDVAANWMQEARHHDLVTDALQLGSEAWFNVQMLSAEYNFDAIVDASELAWDRLEEYNRLTRRPLPIVTHEEIGYRLATDDCGWDCWFGMRGAEPAPVLPPAPVAKSSPLQRDALLTAAISLRSLAAQLEAASDWVANLGGIDVAEVKSGSTAR